MPSNKFCDPTLGKRKILFLSYISISSTSNIVIVSLNTDITMAGQSLPTEISV